MSFCLAVTLATASLPEQTLAPPQMLPAPVLERTVMALSRTVDLTDAVAVAETPAESRTVMTTEVSVAGLFAVATKVVPLDTVRFNGRMLELLENTV